MRRRFRSCGLRDTPRPGKVQGIEKRCRLNPAESNFLDPTRDGPHHPDIPPSPLDRPSSLTARTHRLTPRLQHSLASCKLDTKRVKGSRRFFFDSPPCSAADRLAAGLRVRPPAPLPARPPGQPPCSTPGRLAASGRVPAADYLQRDRPPFEQPPAILTNRPVAMELTLAHDQAISIAKLVCVTGNGIRLAILQLGSMGDPDPSSPLGPDNHGCRAVMRTIPRMIPWRTVLAGSLADRPPWRVDRSGKSTPGFQGRTRHLGAHLPPEPCHLGIRAALASSGCRGQFAEIRLEAWYCGQQDRPGTKVTRRT